MGKSDPIPMRIETRYLKSVLDPTLLPKVVNNTVREIKRSKWKFDTIAFSGMSGAAICFILSHKLKVPLLCVRKQQDSCHYLSEQYASADNLRYLEGNVAVKKYIIVDDFISSGSTVNRIYEKILEQNPKSKCMGMFMYRLFASSNFDFKRNGKVLDTVCVIGTKPDIE